MKTLSVTFFLFSCIALANAKSICYDEIGCFTDEAPFDDMPLPINPAEIGFKWYLYQNGKEARLIQSANELNVDDLIVFTHGLAGNFENTESWHRPIVDNLFKVRPTADILFVDWEKGAAFARGFKMYSQPASNTRVAGPSIMKFLQRNEKFESQRVYCIGFSLGAQVCGFAGKVSKWGRLSALDPASPNFDKDDSSARVDKTDANFVDVIHTSWCGLQRPVGHVDFWANGSKRQPGCVSRRRRQSEMPEGPLAYDYLHQGTNSITKEDNNEMFDEIGTDFITAENRGIVDSAFDFFGCSHYRAPTLFTESITAKDNGCSFKFCPCDSKDDFKNKKCEACTDENAQYLGYYSALHPERQGEFYGRTGKSEPLCLI